MPRPKQIIKIGTWNVRTMFQVGKSRQVTNKMDNYSLDILGISEVRWTGFGNGKLKTSDDKTILYSGMDDKHERGVAFILSKAATKSLIEWEPINERIIRARFFSRYIKMTILQVYAPTNDADDDVKDVFYNQLQREIDRTPKHDLIILMGDLNAKVGRKKCEEERSLGNEACGERNENGEMFVSLCEINNLVIGDSKFKHKEIHKLTWISPDGRSQNQIDHIAINSKFTRSMMDVRVKRGADVSSDHHLVVMNLKLRLQQCCKNKKNGRAVGFDTGKLKCKEIRDSFILEVKNRFAALENKEEIDDMNPSSHNIEEQWKEFEETLQEAATVTLGKRDRKKCKEWISGDTWKLIDYRKKLQNLLSNTKSNRLHELYKQQYKEANKNVKRNCRKDKRVYYDLLAVEAQQAANVGNMKTVFQITKQLSGSRKKQGCNVKDKNGNSLNNTQEIRDRWREHFNETLNIKNDPNPQFVASNVPQVGTITTDEISLSEIKVALKAMKSGKACGGDQIAAEMLKVDTDGMATHLHGIFNTIWITEKIPSRWTESIIVKVPKKGDLSICDNAHTSKNIW